MRPYRLREEVLPAAQQLPDDSRVLLDNVQEFRTDFEHTVRKGPNKGKKVRKIKLLVVFQALHAGTTRDGVTFAAGSRFQQYVPGVFDHGDEVRLSGTAEEFARRLQAVHEGVPGDFSSYVGATFVLELVKGKSNLPEVGEYGHMMPKRPNPLLRHKPSNP